MRKAHPQSNPRWERQRRQEPRRRMGLGLEAVAAPTWGILKRTEPGSAAVPQVLHREEFSAGH